ncbi:hypothetical protein GE061_020155 [Apolygus lucorum]|uniref:BAR domain-containing protein n=1 Tax=Apolygus lucorum TaxID=248454 RepID=A0A6A4J217_APOLU|nr:hypothetical protein GE061_020155 [Apolygus lucorum]
MVLKPLEFTECITDSPLFREKLHAHEKELEGTSQQMKRLIKELKELLSAAQNLSRAQRTLSNTLKNFKFELIGESRTDDESVISQSFAEFGKLIDAIEDERGRMMGTAATSLPAGRLLVLVSIYQRTEMEVVDAEEGMREKGMGIRRQSSLQTRE